MKIKIVNKSTNANPEYANLGDSGMDIRANIVECPPKMFKCQYVLDAGEVLIYPGGRALIKTGIFVGLPKDYELQVRSRSGLALKQGLHVLNSPGTIDEGYINEIGVILQNSGESMVKVSHGDRIAQIVLQHVPKIEWEKVDTLEDTERGLTGFGDSGIK